MRWSLFIGPWPNSRDKLARSDLAGSLTLTSNELLAAGKTGLWNRIFMKSAVGWGDGEAGGLILRHR